ncbi:hypothetical protein ARMSODRAFT_463447 [Armillaria solidipes]|uniref:Mid2 domain-containing protein n=1 Tax=Armillaria solidipes TaxID=1076256 RepID=A0A2H3BBT6_9AGAR|nr:hypothetical protein ARMSODRAFT_463447 [Armillaria solidipes]
MFFLFFQLCTIIALIPLVLSLNITLESAPEAFQSTLISLRWDHADPIEFVLGAFTVDGIVAASANQVVANFTADRIVNMTFNHTSLFGKDCVLLAWLPLPAAQPCNNFAESKPFSVTIGRPGPSATPSESAVSSSTVPGTIPTTSSPTTFSPTTSYSTSSVSGTASNVPPKPASHTGMIVGGVFGILALGCMVSASIYVLIRRRRSNVATPLLRPQDSVALVTLPRTSVNSRSISFHEEPETEVASEVSRAPLEGGNARMREEITTLENQIGGIEPLSEVSIRTEGENARMREEIAALEDRIRRMEAGYWNSPRPPSYRSA